MKKRLLIVFALGLSLASSTWAEDLYLVGDGTIIGWTQNSELQRQPTKMMETSSGVYEWTGLLKHASEGFSIRKNLNWEGYFPTTSNYAISDVGGTSDYNTSSDFKWNPTNTDWGWYTITLDTNQGKFSWASASPTLLEPADDGIYYISTAEQLNTLALMLRNNVNSESYNVKLTADIDYTAYTHSSFATLGVSDEFRFRGDFDGQNHTITINLETYSTHHGLFGIVEGTIHNLKVAGKITATTRNQIGGICGRLKGSNSKIYNCISAVEIADSNTGDGTIGGIVSVTDASTIENCAFYGKINTSRDSNGCIIGWANSGSTIKNCLIVADINWAGGVDFGRNNPTVTNSFKLDASDASLASGEMTYTLNEEVTGGENWFQTLDTDALPSPFSTSQKVYAIGSEGNRCDLVPIGTVKSYTNTTPVVSAHTFVDGICSICGELDESYVTLTDGYYQISTEKQLVWFAKKVQNKATVNGKLTADIVLSSAWTTPVGTQSVPFKGIFDGQNHAITGFNLTYDGGRQGLFGQVDGATVKNFSIAGTITANGNGGSSAGLGVIAWAESSTIQNVHSSLIVDATGTGLGSTHVGGVVGSLQRYNRVERCSFSGQMNGGSNKVDCFGCVVGYMNDGSVISNCANYGKLTYSGSEGSAGGILAYTWANQGGKIENCLNIGKIDYNASNNGGAIVGMLRSYADRVSNNYILEGTASQAYGSQNDSGNTCTIASAAQLASGEVCFGLGSVWSQTLGTDNYPTLDSSKPNVYQLAVGSAGYASFVPTVNVAALPEGVTAYAGQNKGTYLHLEPVTELPKDNAFIVKAEEGKYYYNDTDEAKTLSTSNDLKFFTEATASDGTQYCLANKAQGVGFYKVNAGTQIPAYKAYLQTTSGIKAFYGFNDDDATAIDEIVNGKSLNGKCYNLAGQRISKMQRGINIVDGKKILK